MSEMLCIECITCKATVSAEVIGCHEPEVDSFVDAYRVLLAKCHRCESAIVGEQASTQVAPEELGWGPTRRLWPEPENYLSSDIPAAVRDSLEEAQKCFKVSAFSACAVMCGRAIEAICRMYSEKQTLFEGLEALKDQEIVDGRLYEWGQSLRQERNLGAHATAVAWTREDARDLIDFAIAICEYVFVLSARHQAYLTRKETR